MSNDIEANVASNDNIRAPLAQAETSKTSNETPTYKKKSSSNSGSGQYETVLVAGMTTWKSFWSFWSVYSAFSFMAVLCVFGFSSFFSVTSVFCFLSVNSVFSVLSVNSMFSLGCVNESWTNCYSQEYKNLQKIKAELKDLGIISREQIPTTDDAKHHDTPALKFLEPKVDTSRKFMTLAHNGGMLSSIGEGVVTGFPTPGEH